MNEQIQAVSASTGGYLWSALIIIGLLAGAWLAGNFIEIRVKKMDRIDVTLRHFIGAVGKYTLYILAIVMALTKFGVPTGSLLAVIGAAGLAIGLSLQGTLSNIAAGVMLLFLRPFNVGDFITAGGISGTVKNLGLFATEVATADNLYQFIPNNKIWSSDICNFSRNTQRRHDLVMCISYDDDIDKAMKTLDKMFDSEERIIRTEGKEPKIFVNALADSSVDVVGRYWTKSSDFFATKTDLTKAVKEASDKAGLTIPYPTSTVEYAQPAAVAAPKKAPAKKKAA
jgi:small conductance mechanosensitive channel